MIAKRKENIKIFYNEKTLWAILVKKKLVETGPSP